MRRKRQREREREREGEREKDEKRERKMRRKRKKQTNEERKIENYFKRKVSDFGTYLGHLTNLERSLLGWMSCPMEKFLGLFSNRGLAT